jgi:hypothetical protein
MVNVELPQQARGRIAVVHAELLARPVAVGVHRCLGHAQFARDLLGRQMLIDQPQTLPLSRGEQADGINSGVRARSHGAANKRRHALHVQFSATSACP